MGFRMWDILILTVLAVAAFTLGLAIVLHSRVFGCIAIALLVLTTFLSSRDMR